MAHQQQVAPGLHRHDGGLSHAVGIGDGPHGQIVGTHHPIIAHLLPQQAVHHLWGQGGGQVWVDLGHEDMGHHDAGGPLVNGLLEGDQLKLLQLLRRLVHHRQVHMGVGAGVPVAGEVLDHRDHAPLLQSLVHRQPRTCHRVGVAAVGPVPNDGVVRVGPDVQAGGEVQIETEGGALGGQHLPPLQGVPASGDIIIGGGQVVHLRGHPVHPSPLLIHTQEEGGVVAVEGFQFVGQVRQLLGALHVAAKEDDAAHLVVLNGLEAVLTGLRPPDARHQQLAHLLLGGHGRQGLRHRVRGGGRLRGGRRRGAGGGGRCGRGGGRLTAAPR